MKKLMMIVLCSMVMLLGTMSLVNPSIAEEKQVSILNNDTTKLTLRNDSKNDMVFTVRWKNHPHGCYKFYGKVICDFTKAGGSIDSNEDFITNLLVGGLYCVDWSGKNGDKEYCFEVIDQNPIIMTPDGIQDEVDVIKHPVSIKNCIVGTWVGLVKWIDDENGKHINYQKMPEAELKELGTKVVMLPEGSYAGTHFIPSKVIEIDGVEVTFPAAIIGFQDDLIVDGPETFEFGDCVDLMKNSS